jgi:hypothetical protein
MIVLAAVLATMVSAVLAIPLAFVAPYLSGLPDVLQTIAALGCVAVYFGIWFLAFNLLCNLFKVSK